MFYVVKCFATNNIGDLTSNPLDYFGLSYVKVDLEQSLLFSEVFKSFNPQEDWIVIGGGGLWCYVKPDWLSFLVEILKTFPSRTIVWGIGINYYKPSEFPSIEFVNNARLTGVRNFLSTVPHLPCASCLSPLFQKFRAGPKQHSFGFYLYHLQRPHPPTENAPCKTNNCTLVEALSFISSCEVLYTNCYHGAYWAGLLNVPVILFSCSTKDGFKYPITYLSRALHLKQLLLTKPTVFPATYLEECRSLNLNFATRMCEVVKLESRILFGDNRVGLAE